VSIIIAVQVSIHIQYFILVSSISCLRRFCLFWAL